MFRRTVSLGLLLLSCGVQADAVVDPMRPDFGGPPATNTARPQPSPLELQSTLLSPQRNLAVISGVRLGIGESIRGYRLLSIEPGTALLEKDGRRLELKLVRRPVRSAESIGQKQ